MESGSKAKAQEREDRMEEETREEIEFGEYVHEVLAKVRRK